MPFGAFLNSVSGRPRLLWVDLGSGAVIRDVVFSTLIHPTSICLFQDRLWVGGRDGIVRADLNTFRAEAVFFPPSGGPILQVGETDGGLCVLTGCGVYYMDYLGEFKRLRDVPAGVSPTRMSLPYLLVPRDRGVYDMNRSGYVYTHHKDIKDTVIGCMGDYVFVADDEGLFGVGVETRRSVRIPGDFVALEPLYFRQPNTIGRGLVAVTSAAICLITGDPPALTRSISVGGSASGPIAGLRLMV